MSDFLIFCLMTRKVVQMLPRKRTMKMKLSIGTCKETTRNDLEILEVRLKGVGRGGWMGSNEPPLMEKPPYNAQDKKMSRQKAWACKSCDPSHNGNTSSYLPFCTARISR